MRKTTLFCVMGYLGCAMLSEAAIAMVIVNGAFDTDLSAWHDASQSGSVQYDPIHQSAILSSGIGSSAYSAVLMQGDDGNLSFAEAQTLIQGDDWLTFDVDFEVSGFDAQESGTGLNDSFQVLMYDANDAGSDVNLFNLFMVDGIGESLHFSVDMSYFVGRRVALSFELSDENDGFDYRINLDNVRLESRDYTIPLPNSLSLLFSGLLAEWLRISRFRNRHAKSEKVAL